MVDLDIELIEEGVAATLTYGLRTHKLTQNWHERLIVQQQATASLFLSRKVKRRAAEPALASYPTAWVGSGIYLIAWVVGSVYSLAR